VEGNWIETPVAIRQATVDFFKNQFQVEWWARPTSEGIAFPCLTKEDNTFLISPFLLEEIEGVVMESDGNKNPGPDCFNFNFVKSFWYLLKSEARILFDQFHGNASLPKSFLSYFVALIPKVNSPLSE
jgi:hypothetical protein